jgi:hypothetical protein
MLNLLVHRVTRRLKGARSSSWWMSVIGAACAQPQQDCLLHAYSTAAPSLLGLTVLREDGYRGLFTDGKSALAWRWTVTYVTGVLLSTYENRFVLGSGDTGKQIVSCLWPITVQFELKIHWAISAVVPCVWELHCYFPFFFSLWLKLFINLIIGCLWTESLSNGDQCNMIDAAMFLWTPVCFLRKVNLAVKGPNCAFRVKAVFIGVGQ